MEGVVVGALVGTLVGMPVEGVEEGLADGNDKKISGMGGTHSSAASDGTPQRQNLLRQHCPEAHSSPPKQGVMAEKLECS